MRLIGNKTRLLGAIEAFLRERGVCGGTFLDVFAGTASVARHFRKLGFSVSANDLMFSSYATQRAYLTLEAYPPFQGVREQQKVRRYLRSRAGRRVLSEAPDRGPGGAEGLAEVLVYLNSGLPAAEGLFSSHYSEGGSEGRLYFSRENGGRIDAVHRQLVRWRRAGRLDESEFYLLLVALLEGADRVANISGTYGAFLKRLQASAREPLRLRIPQLELLAPPGRAYREDANQLVRRLPVDVVYLDPPYNHRQYAKNYHVLEILAELHETRDSKSYRSEIYGKTGLRRFEDRLSKYCRRSARKGHPSPCEEAFRDLVINARAEHLVVSYSEEGILSREAIGSALAEAAGQRSFDFERDHLELAYRRFRSDRDAQGRREYRVLKGRARDEVREWLFYVHKPRVKIGRV